MKFSIAMCTYNGAMYVREQLESIAAQTRLPDELVICDDCSSDWTREIIKEFAATVSLRVRLYVNEKNLGYIKNFERAIGLCTGDVIALSDQDDVWCEHKLERVEQCFKANPEAGLVFSDAEVVDENLRPIGKRLWQFTFPDKARRMVEDGRAIDALARGENFVTGATMAFLSKFKKTVLPIPTGIFVIHDGWIALMVAASSKLAFIPETLIKYRQHPDQQMGARSKRKTLTQEQEHRASSRTGGLENIVRFYQSEIELYRDVRERLLAASRAGLEKQNTSAIDSVIAQLKERASHFQIRAQMPERRLGRVPQALKELYKFRYHRYSNGLYSFARDIFL